MRPAASILMAGKRSSGENTSVAQLHLPSDRAPSRRCDTGCHLPRLVKDAPNFKSIPSTPPISAGKSSVQESCGERREEENREEEREVRGEKWFGPPQTGPT
ncbi:hypothetical protein ACLB2K_037964 [Fragaria x ananassa]